MKDEIDLKRIEKMIAEIRKASEDGEAVFRGEHREFPRPAASAIYRNREDKKIFDDTRLQPGDVEKEIVENARREVFSPNTPTVEILTELRYFGADTALIEFSRDMMVALFFACNGEADQNGRVWVLPTKGMKKLEELDRECIHGIHDIHGIHGIHEENRKKEEMTLITPGQTGLSHNRFEAQSSVFVHARQGFVSKNHMRPIKVPHELKQDCVVYLEKFHHVSYGTLYSDLSVFIENERNTKTTRLKFFEGLRKGMEGNHDAAIADYDEAIRLRLDDPDAYVNRGYSKSETGDYAGAILDFNEAIRLQPDNPEAILYRDMLKKKPTDGEK